MARRLSQFNEDLASGQVIVRISAESLPRGQYQIVWKDSEYIRRTLVQDPQSRQAAMTKLAKKLAGHFRGSRRSSLGIDSKPKPINHAEDKNSTLLQPEAQSASVSPLKEKTPYQIIDGKVTLIVEQVYGSRGSPSAVRIKILRPGHQRLLKNSVKPDSSFDFEYLNNMYRVLVYETSFHQKSAKVVIQQL